MALASATELFVGMATHVNEPHLSYLIERDVNSAVVPHEAARQEN